MSAILDYLIEPLLILLLFIAFILLFIVGIVFWYVAFPILIIVTTVRTFNRTQEKYKYDLKFWIESLNILDFLLIITHGHMKTRLIRLFDIIDSSKLFIVF